MILSPPSSSAAPPVASTTPAVEDAIGGRPPRPAMDMTDELPAAGLKVEQSEIHPCPDNNAVYGVQSLDDPDIVALIESIRAKGIMDPIHISTDNVIISGHRRRFCALQAGLRVVRVIRWHLSYTDDREAFLNLLVEANTQRKKTVGMLLSEAAMKINPKEAVQALRTERKERDAELARRAAAAEYFKDWRGAE